MIYRYKITYGCGCVYEHKTDIFIYENKTFVNKAFCPSCMDEGFKEKTYQPELFEVCG